MLWVLCGKSTINFVCMLLNLVSSLVLFTSIAPLAILVMAGGFNGHVGQHSQEFSRHHGGYGYGTQNQEGMSISDLCAAPDFAFMVLQIHSWERECFNKLNTTQEGVQPTLITSWLEEQSWNSLRMLKSLEMKNAFHKTNYLLQCSRFKLPQKSHVWLL